MLPPRCSVLRHLHLHFRARVRVAVPSFSFSSSKETDALLWRGGRHPRDVPANGYQILNDPAYNRGMAFTAAQRKRLGLNGLLPPLIVDPLTQQERVLAKYHKLENDLDKFVYLMGLQDRNQNLFYSLLVDNLKEFMPIVYTPTVGAACQNYSRIFQRPRGLYISMQDKGHVDELLKNWPEMDVRVIVCTDGERILGLGDLGAQGMGIPVGKLSLYTACAGLHPHQCLPVLFDVGTNRTELREDPLYIGLPIPRRPLNELEELIDEFMDAVARRYGHHCLVQFEDFANHSAFHFLEKYRNSYCMFNDDIQGTASVVVSGLKTATRLSGVPLKDNIYLFLGAGEAGTGIGMLMTTALMKEGLSEEEAKRRCWYVDSKGLVVKSRSNLPAHKAYFAHDHPGAPDLHSAITALKPTALIGATGSFGAFQESHIKEMASFNKRPIVFALSNPTSRAECTNEQAISWSNGAAIFSSGSPFQPFEFNGRTYVPGQGNNAYIFPGVGLGLTSVNATRVTDDMFLAAAEAVSESVSQTDLDQDCIFPPLASIRDVSSEIAAHVAYMALKMDGCVDISTDKTIQRLHHLVHSSTQPKAMSALRQHAERSMYVPHGSKLYYSLLEDDEIES